MMDCTELDEVEARLPDDPATLSIDELRSLRNDLQRAESGLSYVRRVLQGRLDIVADERRQRRSADGVRSRRRTDVGRRGAGG
ncbi:MAG: hypothetical protein R2704_07410 [Microthrixaceae bacterium]